MLIMLNKTVPTWDMPITFFWEETIMEIGHVIARLRNDKKISQRELATALNVSTGVVGMWETNKRLPSFECVISLADFFGISTDMLFEKDRTLKPTQYNSSITVDNNTKKILDTFSLLNEDNRDILIGEAKKLLKTQRLEEKRKSTPIQKIT